MACELGQGEQVVPLPRNKEASLSLSRLGLGEFLAGESDLMSAGRSFNRKGQMAVIGSSAFTRLIQSRQVRTASNLNAHSPYP